MHPHLYLNESIAPQDAVYYNMPTCCSFWWKLWVHLSPTRPPIPNSFRLTVCKAKGCAVRPIAWGRIDVLRNNSWPHGARRKKLCSESYWPPGKYFELLNIILYKYQNTDQCIYFPWLIRNRLTKQQSIWLTLSRRPVGISAGTPTSLTENYCAFSEFIQKCQKSTSN
jgi:hypothetical protein